MKFKKTITLFLSIVISASLVLAGNSSQSTIKVHARVIPILGIIQSVDNTQSFSIREKNNTEILIQTAKNSELFVSLSIPSEQIQKDMILSSAQSILFKDKNSVLDVIPIDLLENQIRKEDLHMITVIRVDN